MPASILSRNGTDGTVPLILGTSHKEKAVWVFGTRVQQDRKENKGEKERKIEYWKDAMHKAALTTSDRCPPP